MFTTQSNGTFLHVTITVAPSDADAFLKALRPCWQACIEEPECLFFDVTHDPKNPGVFKFVEAWTEGFEWFINVQLKKPYYEPYIAITEPMWIKPRQLDLTERVPGFCVVKPQYHAGTK